MSLDDFLREIADEPVKWGWNDCSAVPYRWLLENGIVAELPEYGSRDEAHAIIDRHGSLAATWDWSFRNTELSERFGDALIGDIAVIDTRIYGQIGGIVAHGGILAIRKDDGNFHWFGPTKKFIKVWAVT